MSNIPLPPVNTLVNIQPVGVSATSQNSSQPPTALSNLANGTLVTGFVVQRDTHNQPILRTEFGDVLVNTSLFLKTGTEVVLRVDSSQPNHARIISINGQTPEAFAKIQATQSTSMNTDIVATSVSTELASTVPKPVSLAGMLLQMQPDKAIPTPLLEAALKTLGISRAAALDSIPVDIVIRALLKRTPTQEPASQQTNRTAAPLPSAQPPQPGYAGTEGIPALPAGARSPIQAISSQLNPLPDTPPFKPAAPSPLPETGQTQQAQPQTLPPLRPLPPQAMVQQQNILSSQSLPPDTADAQTASLPPKATTSAPKTEAATSQYQAELGNLARSINSNTPLPATYPTAPEQRLPGEPHPAFRNLIPSQPITITPQNTLRMEAQVIGQESGGDTILHTPLGIVKAFTAKPMPPGATATIEIRPSLSQPQQPGTLPSSLPEDMQEIAHLARDWPALTSLLTGMQKIDPALYQNLATHTLPTTGKTLTHGMLFFLAALKGGDMRTWLGNRVTEALESRQPELLRRLGIEFTGLQQASVESSNQGWMTTVIPIMHEQALHQARLFIRQEKEEEKSEAKGGQRFIIEVDLSQFGEMQFDGFVMKEGTRHQFDMIVRSIRPLPLEMQQDIRTLYDNAAQMSGFKGMLTFQSNRDQFVRPLSSMRKDTGSGILA